MLVVLTLVGSWVHQVYAGPGADALWAVVDPFGLRSVLGEE